MQKIILCPRCRRQIKPDNLGELICPVCNLRLCPNNHAFDGKICPYCGHEDPNYNLYLKALQARQQRRERATEEPGETKATYICPKCGTNVDITLSRCPACGLMGAKAMASKPTPVGPPPIASRAAVQVKPIWNSVPREQKQKKEREPKSTFVREVEVSSGRHFEFPPLKQFVRPVLAATLAGIVLTGLIFGGIYAARFIGQRIETGTLPSISLPPITVSAPVKTFILSTSTVPQTGGEIKITPVPPGNGAFESGSQVTVTAVPGDCYTFNYWDGVQDSAETITITMDSDKTLTANFKLKYSQPPVISGIVADTNSDISATISWLTDKPATGQVDYGTTKEYGLSAVADGGLVTTHNIHVAGLKPNTTYYFLVRSADACGNEANETKTAITAREITYGERVGQRALDFSLPYYYDENPDSPNKSGSETLNSYIGKKKIMLNFWSTFCGACIGEFPYIREIYQDENYARLNSADSDFEVLTVCIDSNVSQAPPRIEKLEAKFGKDTGPFTFPILMDSVGQTKKDYHIWTIPESIFIDSDGIIREVKIGRFQTIDEIKTILNSLN